MFYDHSKRVTHNVLDSSLLCKFDAAKCPDGKCTDSKCWKKVLKNAISRFCLQKVIKNSIFFAFSVITFRRSVLERFKNSSRSAEGGSRRITISVHLFSRQELDGNKSANKFFRTFSRTTETLFRTFEPFRTLCGHKYPRRSLEGSMSTERFELGGKVLIKKVRLENFQFRKCNK